MALSYISALQSEVMGGFDFSNHYRNEWLVSPDGGNIKMPEAIRTGTTICGLVCGDNTVVMGADTRCTFGTTVALKETQKINPIGKNMLMAGAGVAADMQHMAHWLNRSVTLSSLNMKSPLRVTHAVTVLGQELFKYQGYIQLATILGGVDYRGASLYQIAPDGNITSGPFLSMGSGSLNAIAQLEIGYRSNMTKEEGIALIIKAVRSGALNDLGSGNAITISYVSADQSRTIHHMYESFISPPSEVLMPLPIGTTRYLSERIESVIEKKSNATQRESASEEVEMAE